MLKKIVLATALAALIGGPALAGGKGAEVTGNPKGTQANERAADQATGSPPRDVNTNGADVSVSAGEGGAGVSTPDGGE